MSACDSGEGCQTHRAAEVYPCGGGGRRGSGRQTHGAAEVNPHGRGSRRGSGRGSSGSGVSGRVSGGSGRGRGLRKRLAFVLKRPAVARRRANNDVNS